MLVFDGGWVDARGVAVWVGRGRQAYDLWSDLARHGRGAEDGAGAHQRARQVGGGWMDASGGE